MITILAIICLHLIGFVEPQSLSDIYNFPMLGTLQYDMKTTYGSVTIVHKKMVLAAAENLVQLDPKALEFIFEDDQRDRLFVCVGSDVMTPPNEDYEKGKIQRATVNRIYFGLSSEFTTALSYENLSAPLKDRFKATYRTTAQRAPGTIRGNTIRDFPKDYIFNPFHELQWDVAVITLNQELRWTPYVLPIRFRWALAVDSHDSLAQSWVRAWDIIEKLETDPHSYVPCSVPGWSTAGSNEIIYHRVVYVRFRECAEAICGAYPSSCLRYQNNRHHFCFKSTSFADSCVLDQGAPVLCSYFQPFVLGIVVKTFGCGTETLPTVFTRIDAIEAFVSLSDIPPDMDKIEPGLDDPRYLEKPIER